MSDAINQKLSLDATSAISSITSLDASIDKMNMSMAAVNKQMEASASVSSKLSTSFNSVSTVVGGAGTSVTNFGNTVVKTSNSSKKGIDSISQSMSKLEQNASMMAKILQVQLFIRGFNLITQGFKSAVAEALEFNKAIGEISTISGSALGGIKQISAGVRELANELGRPIAEVAEAAYETISNYVVDTADSFDFLRDAQTLALATNSSLIDSVEALSSAMNSYKNSNLSASEASDVLFRSVDLGRLRLTEVANTLGKFLPLTAEMGVSMKEASAAFVTMTQAGVKANTAIIYMRALMTSLLKPSEAMRGIFDELGASSFPELVKSSGGFNLALNKIMESAEGAGIGVEKLTPNTRALNALLTITGNNAERFATVLDKMQVSAGAAAEAAAKMEETDYWQLTAATNELKNAFVTMGESAVAVLAKFSPLISGIAANIPALTGAVVTGSTIIIGQFTLLTAKALGLTTSLSALWAAAWPAGLAVLAGASIGFAVSKISEFKNSTLNSLKEIEGGARELQNTAAYVSENMANKFAQDFQKIKDYANNSFKGLDAATKTFINSVKNGTKAMAEIFGQDTQAAMSRAREQLKAIEEGINDMSKAQQAFSKIYKDGSTEQLKLEKEIRNASSDNQRALILEEKSAKALKEAYSQYHDIITGMTPASEDAINRLNEKFKESADLQSKAAGYYKEGTYSFERAKDKEIKIMEERDRVAKKGEAVMKTVAENERNYLRQQIGETTLLIEKLKLLTQEKQNLIKTKGSILDEEDTNRLAELNTQIEEIATKMKTAFSQSRLDDMLGVGDLGKSLSEAITGANQTLDTFVSSAKTKLRSIADEALKINLEFNVDVLGDTKLYNEIKDIIYTEVDPNQGLIKALNLLSTKAPEANTKLRETKAALDGITESNDALAEHGAKALEKFTEAAGDLSLAGTKAAESWEAGLLERMAENPDAKIGELLSKYFEGSKSDFAAYGTELGEKYLNAFNLAVESGDVKAAEKLANDFISIIQSMNEKVGDVAIFQESLKEVNELVNQVGALNTKIQATPPLKLKDDVAKAKGELSAAINLTNQLTDAIDRYNKSSSARKESEAAMAKEVEKLKASQDDNLATIERAKSATEATTEATREVGAAASDAKGKIDGVGKSIDNAKGLSDGLNSSFQVLPTKADAAAGALMNVLDPIEGITTGTSAIADNLAASQTNAQALQTGFSGVATAIQSIATLLPGLSTFILPLSTSATTISTSFTSLLNTILAMQVSLPVLSQSLLQASTNAGAIGDKLDTSKVTNFTDSLNDLAKAASITVEVDYSALEEMSSLIDSVIGQVSAMTESFYSINEPIKSADYSLQGVQSTLSNLDSLIKTVERNMDSFANSAGKAKQAVDKIDDGIPALISAINKAISAMNQLTAAANKAAAAARAAASASASAGVANSGKFVTRASGGGIGTDTVSAMLSPGEFVMNSKQSRQFYSQLVAMNAGAYNSGGGVATNNISNVSDITINVNESQNAGQTAREIANILNRGTSRGIIKLN